MKPLSRLFHLDHSHSSFLNVHRNLYALNSMSSFHLCCLCRGSTLCYWESLGEVVRLLFFRFTVNRSFCGGKKGETCISSNDK